MTRRPPSLGAPGHERGSTHGACRHAGRRMATPAELAAPPHHGLATVRARPRGVAHPYATAVMATASPLAPGEDPTTPNAPPLGDLGAPAHVSRAALGLKRAANCLASRTMRSRSSSLSSLPSVLGCFWGSFES